MPKMRATNRVRRGACPVDTAGTANFKEGGGGRFCAAGDPAGGWMGLLPDNGIEHFIA